jgi:hypothetical protein
MPSSDGELFPLNIAGYSPCPFAGRPLGRDKYQSFIRIVNAPLDEPANTG